MYSIFIGQNEQITCYVYSLAWIEMDISLKLGKLQKVLTQHAVILTPRNTITHTRSKMQFCNFAIFKCNFMPYHNLTYCFPI